MCTKKPILCFHAILDTVFSFFTDNHENLATDIERKMYLKSSWKLKYAFRDLTFILRAPVLLKLKESRQIPKTLMDEYLKRYGELQKSSALSFDLLEVKMWLFYRIIDDVFPLKILLSLHGELIHFIPCYITDSNISSRELSNFVASLIKPLLDLFFQFPISHYDKYVKFQNGAKTCIARLAKKFHDIFSIFKLY